MSINVKIVEPFLRHVDPGLLIDGLDDVLWAALEQLVGGGHHAEGALRHHDLGLSPLVPEDPVRVSNKRSCPRVNL